MRQLSDKEAGERQPDRPVDRPTSTDTGRKAACNVNTAAKSRIFRDAAV
jgi:hypothetical protein